MIKITPKMVNEVWLRTGANLHICMQVLLLNKGNVELAVKFIKEMYLDFDTE